jgi:CO/xanthine dehydrogenase Mo-binding subunit
MTDIGTGSYTILAQTATEMLGGSHRQRRLQRHRDQGARLSGDVG